MLRLIVLSFLVALAFGASFKSIKFRLDGRIVGGSDVDIKDYPYQISLMLDGGHICGGSIISATHVITAAHCIQWAAASDFQVRAGSSTKDSGGVVVQVAKLHPHPAHDNFDNDNDIAVLKLAESLEFNENIQPISFNFQQPAVGVDAVASGWGALIEDGDSPSHLQAVTVPIISQDNCQKAYPSSLITDAMLCAGFPEGGKDACNGDSGGPLVIDGILVGVVSWSKGCARPGNPGVYANVPNLADFVLGVTGPL